MNVNWQELFQDNEFDPEQLTEEQREGVAMLLDYMNHACSAIVKSSSTIGASHDLEIGVSIAFVSKKLLELVSDLNSGMACEYAGIHNKREREAEYRTLGQAMGSTLVAYLKRKFASTSN